MIFFDIANHRLDDVAPLKPGPRASFHAALAVARHVDGDIAYPFRVALVTLATIGVLRIPTNQP